MNDFNKAWNQKKHRDGLQGKKACNFTLDIEVKHQLDELAENNGMKKNEYIESLIRREYSKINE
ncbi:hypothetical protein JCM19233_3501 [Vibrio astriarenae]|nr:hypothetical protein JCM19233_3501 [Vibrio sp. C7]